MSEPKLQTPDARLANSLRSEEARNALIERLARIRPVPAHLRPPQPSAVPETTPTRSGRFRRKHLLLLQRTRNGRDSESSGLPPAPDPLAP